MLNRQLEWNILRKRVSCIPELRFLSDSKTHKYRLLLYLFMYLSFAMNELLFYHFPFSGLYATTKSSEHIYEKGDGPHRGFDHLSPFKKLV